MTKMCGGGCVFGCGSLKCPPFNCRVPGFNPETIAKLDDLRAEEVLTPTNEPPSAANPRPFLLAGLGLQQKHILFAWLV